MTDPSNATTNSACPFDFARGGTMPSSGREEWLTLVDALRMIPGPPHIGTVVRWALQGVKIAGSPVRVKLGTKKIGGRRFTNSALISEFIARLNTTGLPDGAVPQRRAESVAQAEQEMDAEGII